MRLLNKPIEVIAHYPDKGEPRPLRFRYITEEGSEVVVKIEKILEIRKEKSPDHGPMLLYRCQSRSDDRVVDFELRFLIDKLKWHLHKA